MTQRDRIVVMVIGVVVVIAAGWIMFVSPERKKASKLGSEVTSAQATLSSAEGQLANARSAQAQYATAYSSIVGLGKAVPADQEVPSLIYQLERASNSKKVEFSSIVTGSSAGASASTSGPAPAAAAAASAGFTQMPFTFVFNGSYFDLEHLFHSLNKFTVRTTSGGLQVSGRLLTVTSVKLTPVTNTGEAPSGQLTGTITATAYVLPATQGLTAGATPSAPAGASTTVSSGASTSPVTPAVAQVSP
jgi:Tfp pilus assembly protein PilO